MSARPETFVGQRRFLWLWICLLALSALIGLYVADRPIGGRNGGTHLGIAYGALAAAGILFLMWYGVRKRYSYARGSFTLKAWLGPHVWIGLSLALIVPLHCGFQLRWNLHSAPYLLMLLTIASGVWGAYAFLRLPSEMSARREGITLRGGVEQIEALAGEIAAQAKGRSEALGHVAAKVTVPFEPSFIRVLMARPFPAFTKAELGALLSKAPPEEYQLGLQVTALAFRRIALANRLLAEASVVARMRLWLYVHVPLSFGCVLAVAAHVFWVLFYRWSAR